MEVQRTTEVKVGLTIGAAIALFMITTILLGGGRKIFKSVYTLRVHFDSVAGVSPGSVVQVLGIPVGNVKRILFVPGSTKLEIEMEVQKEFVTRITQGATAGVRTQGALGDKYIYITPGPEQNEVVKDGDILATEEGGDFFASLAKHGEDFGRVFDMVGELNQLLANLNADGKSAQLMPNLVKSTDELHKALASMNAVLEDVHGKNGEGGLSSSMAHLDNVLRKIDKGQGTLGALVNDPEIHERIKAALGGSSHNVYLKNQVRETIRSEK